MKNIHILPTDKPSRLHFNEFEELLFTPKYEKLEGVNIYITSSNADINENDYIITKDVKLVQVSYLLSKDLEEASKIILTTDLELQKDGIQAIDDKFLEWFVKNPSCEEVEVEMNQGRYFDYGGNVHITNAYKIIIPKEEPKQEKLDFVYWLMDNCELITDSETQENVLWRYDSEDYTVEGLFKLFVDFSNPNAIKITKEEPKNICIQTGLPCGMQCLSKETCNENLIYKIIIPKEEPKKNWYCAKCESYVSSESVTFEETHQICNTGVIIEEDKQETLEEALNNYIAKKHTQEECVGFIDGFQLAKEKTIEEVFEWLTTNNYLTDLKETLIENFKNR